MWEPREEPSLQGVVVRIGFLKEEVSGEVRQVS